MDERVPLMADSEGAEPALLEDQRRCAGRITSIMRRLRVQVRALVVAFPATMFGPQVAWHIAKSMNLEPDQMLMVHLSLTLSGVVACISLATSNNQLLKRLLRQRDDMAPFARKHPRTTVQLLHEAGTDAKIEGDVLKVGRSRLLRTSYPCEFKVDRTGDAKNADS